jgi:hypothetical protein
MVLQHALVDAAGDRPHLARLSGDRHAPVRRTSRTPRVVAIRHEGRRISIRVRVVLGPAS